MISSLHEDERTALIYERDHKWHGPFMLWYSIGLCAIGAATQGWDQTGANGANLSFPEEFGLTGEGKNEWIVGLINSIIFLTAGLMCVVRLSDGTPSFVCRLIAYTREAELSTKHHDHGPLTI